MRQVVRLAIFAALLLGISGFVQGQQGAIVSPNSGNVANWWNTVLQGNAGARLLTCDAVALAIDNSGSIHAKGRLGWEKACALRALEELAKMKLQVNAGVIQVKPGANDATVVIYSFNSNISTLALPGGQATTLMDLVQADGAAVKLTQQTEDAINGIRDTDNLTWLGGAVALDANRRQCPFIGGTNRVLFLFTDHEPTTPSRNGPFQLAAAIAEFRAAVNWFFRNCSALILTAFDATGTTASDLFTSIAVPDSGVYHYATVATTSVSPERRSLSLALAETDTVTGKVAVLPDDSVHVAGQDAVTLLVSWDLDEVPSGQWLVLMDARNNDPGAGPAHIGGIKIGLSGHNKGASEADGGNSATGNVSTKKGSALVTVVLPPMETHYERPGWRYQVVLLEGNSQTLVAQSNVLEVALPNGFPDGEDISGVLAAGDDRSIARGDAYYADRYSFAGVAGQRVQLQLDSNGFDTYLYLLGPTGDVLAYNDDSGGRPNSALTFSLVETGNYVVEATSYGSERVGSYMLKRTLIKPCAVLNTSIGRTHMGALSASDCRSDARGAAYYADCYTVSGSAGQRIEIRLTSTAFDTYLYLRGPNGAVLAFSDDSDESTNSVIGLILPASGVYGIEVTSYSENALGDYALAVSGL